MTAAAAPAQDSDPASELRCASRTANAKCGMSGCVPRTAVMDLYAKLLGSDHRIDWGRKNRKRQAAYFRDAKYRC
jgi:hypothetical protein